MIISTCVEFRGLDKMEERFKRLRDNGFDSCQIHSWEREVWTDENADGLNKLMKQYGITPTSFWCGWDGPKAGCWNFYDGPNALGLVPVEYRFDRMNTLCDGADFAKKLGIVDVITHMGFIPENPNDPNFSSLCVAIRYVAEHYKRNGQYLLFETGQETPVTMLRCFEVVGTDNLGVNFDTANLICYGKANPVDALYVIGKYVRNIHAKDSDYPPNGHDLGKETRIGEGRVDFKGVFKKLIELGYDGYVTIEREIPEGKEQLKDILESREYLLKKIAEARAELGKA